MSDGLFTYTVEHIEENEFPAKISKKGQFVKNDITAFLHKYLTF